MDRFGVDSYMYNLYKDIRNNDYINNLKVNNKYLNVTKTYLRDQLDLFCYLDIKLNNVYAKYRNKTCYTNPKNIKIILGENLNGFTSSHVYRTPLYYFNNFKDIELLCWYVFINNHSSYCIEESYVHEMVHTQLVYGRNVINYRYIEILPIFFEILKGHSLDKDSICYRLKRYADSINSYMNTNNDDIRRISSTYIDSTLKAIDLYDLYINSSYQVKKELLKDIQDIFYFELTIDDLLKKYAINYDNFKPSLQRLLSYEK